MFFYGKNAGYICRKYRNKQLLPVIKNLTKSIKVVLITINMKKNFEYQIEVFNIAY